MKSRCFLVTLLACAGSQAIAAQIPAAGSKDARMRTVIYDPSQVVRLSTAIGSALVVSFSVDEKVTAVAVSDSKDLVANPRANFLFMKSKTALPLQPIIVLTSGPKGVRRYVFDIQSGPSSTGGGSQNVYYSVEFVYPGDQAAIRAAAREQRAATRRLARVHEELDNATRDPPTDHRNWRYIARGNRALLPVEVFDDGYSTSFRFPGNTRIPSIFRINPDGREATVNYSVNGGYVVVGGVAPGWRLRDGNTVLCMWNRAYDKVGRSPGTDTTSAKVARITRNAPR